MKRASILTVVFLIFCSSSQAQKTDGFIYGGGLNVGLPLMRLSKTHSIGLGGDFVVEHKPKYKPPKDIFDFFSFRDFNYTLSVGYMTFFGRDSTPVGQKIKRKNYSIIPLLLGYKLQQDGKYVHIQIGYSLIRYGTTDYAFTYAVNWGISRKKTDISIRLQGTIKENSFPGFFAGIITGANSDAFKER